MHICSFTTYADVTLTIDGHVFRFEWSDRFGPALLGKRGELLQDGRKVPDPRSPFWKALRWWQRQGQRVEVGQAIYDPVAPRLSRWLKLGNAYYPDTPKHRAKFVELGAPIESVELTDEDV